MVRRVLSAIVVLLLAAPLYAITTKSMADGLTIADLAAMMTRSGATGSPKTYQGYTSYLGMAFSSITGATGPALLTPPLSETPPFWVRVTTPCGSTDSAPAFVTVP